MHRVAVRIWLPDQPGMLGAVASRIAGVGGNVVGFEVLEREGGVAVDELLVELGDPGLAEAMCRSLGEIPGAGIEDVRPVATDVGERGLQVIEAAVGVLAAASPSAAVTVLVELLGGLFELEWLALADLHAGSTSEAMGVVPSLPWLRAFAAAAHGRDGDPDTAGSGVLAEELTERRQVLFIGRSVPFRGRERREFEMLVKVGDRMCRPLHGDRIPQDWGARPRFVN